MENVINHPGRVRGALANYGSAGITGLDSVLTAYEAGLLVIAPEVSPEQRAEIHREMRMERLQLECLKEHAGVTGYCGSFHMDQLDRGEA